MTFFWPWVDEPPEAVDARGCAGFELVRDRGWKKGLVPGPRIGKSARVKRRVKEPLDGAGTRRFEESLSDSSSSLSSWALISWVRPACVAFSAAAVVVPSPLSSSMLVPVVVAVVVYSVGVADPAAMPPVDEPLLDVPLPGEGRETGRVRVRRIRVFAASLRDPD